MNTALIYLSDHGGSLGESGIYLHRYALYAGAGAANAYSVYVLAVAELREKLWHQRTVFA